ncbi:MAG: helix-turn-helix domain-containing protein [Bacteroidaceae bacterium]
MRVMNICIGEEIKKVLANRKMTKAELARRLGIKPQSVEYLLKRKSIDTDMLYKVSIALDFDFSRFYSIRRESQTDFDKVPADCKKVKAKVVIELDLEPEELAKLDLAHKARMLMEGGK